MPSSYVIGEHFEAFIRDQVKQGRYATASEVVRDGLRVLEERAQYNAVKLEVLRAAIQEGAASGEGVPADEAFRRVRTHVTKAASVRPRKK